MRTPVRRLSAGQQRRTAIACLFARRARLWLLDEPHAGLDFARNRAMREATGDWIAFLDDDTVVDSGWLCGLQAAWTECPDASAVTGLVLPYELETEAQLLFEGIVVAVVVQK